MTTSEDVLYREKRGPVELLTITRPARRNSMDSVLIEAFRAAFLAIEQDESVAAVVLNGINPGFCAGSDLKFIGRLDLNEMCRYFRFGPGTSRPPLQRLRVAICEA